jgi:putative SOS response-associated peptidase YedK
MPVILREEPMARWLDPSPMAQPEFLNIGEAYPASEMREHEVSTFINSVRHEGPKCFGPPTPHPVETDLPPRAAKAADPNQLGLDL